MNAEIPIALCALGGTTAAITLAFSFPALTENGSSGTTQIMQEAEFRAAHDQEMSYCQTARLGLNCICFARTSGMILAHVPAHRGLATYVTQRDLARSQARQKC